MGIHFTVDRRERLVYYVVEGTVTAGDARAFLDAAVAHPQYGCGFDFFGDRREAAAAPDPCYVYAVAAEVLARAAVLGPCRWAVVVADEAAARRARVWAALAKASGVEIRPFGTAAEAAAWLGLPATYAPPAGQSAAPSAGPSAALPAQPPAVAAETRGDPPPTTADEPLPLAACAAPR
jgi:hypothetical protein